MKISYPDIYNLCQNQEATVEEMWSHNGWNFSFRRLLNDSEIGRTTEFLNTLEGLIDSEDCMVWKGDSQGRFSVKSAYRDFNRSNNQVDCWPWS
uniref:Putative ovule protein n=1 Tax=Solanum chacoense TaxID=4108 RepID=A0A0V0GSQ3_SOLCH